MLYLVLKTLKDSGHEHVYSVTEKPVLFSQTAAVLEVAKPKPTDSSLLYHGLQALLCCFIVKLYIY